MHHLQFVVLLLCVLSVQSDKFPSEFKFGVATASYQIEGGWNANGKSENIWDRLTHAHPDWVKDHTTGDIACDSYHKYADDVQALKDLEVNFYRFSLSWTRLLPNGYATHKNPDGVRYYNELIDKLIENGIEPMVTLYHWDLPQSLQDLGGWTNPILIQLFEDYARVAFKLFGDRVKTWITFNEPVQTCKSGYGLGDDAPAYNYSGTADYLCGHTLLLAHARAYRLYHHEFHAKQNGSVGISINSIWAEPKSDGAKDLEAAERYMQMATGWWMNPILSRDGDYPAIMQRRIHYNSKMEKYSTSRLPAFTKSEIVTLRGSFDFLGLNHYSTWLASDAELPPNAPTSFAKDVGVRLEMNQSWNATTLPWLRVVPWGFRKLVNWIRETYNNPMVYVTENGFVDTGEMQDDGRINYHQEYMKALLKAITQDGCNVKAYTAWSLMDNMEWREGYTAKFGLYHVDFNSPNRTRTPKASAHYFKSVIQTRTP